MRAPVWVIGSRGLLGKAVVAELSRGDVTPLTTSIPWIDSSDATRVLTDTARALARDHRGESWTLFWLAGAAVNGSRKADFDAEVSALGATLDALRDAGPGTVLLASSAGGVYAGRAVGPHTEASPVQPISHYGRAKLAAERLVLEYVARTESAAVIARLANLYGPGQNLAKPQGLVSHLCRGYLTGEPVPIYVSMDTIRDYLFVTDAAEMLVDMVRLAGGHYGQATIKIVASGRPVTVGSLLGACRVVFHRPPNVVLASSALASTQGHDLRLRSIVWPDVDRRSHRSLVAGVSATLQSIRQETIAV